jgi:hypothetical protein
VSTRLLDGNVLVALVIREHEFHDRCSEWMGRLLSEEGSFATCPVTEGTFLRLHMMLNPSPCAAAAWGALAQIQALPGHEFWTENFSYAEIEYAHLQGHRQITDGWLATLARRQGGVLATLDVPLATLYSEVVELVPVVL